MVQEEVELLEELTPPLDMAKIHSGDISPVYFGSAMNNFGVGFLSNSPFGELCTWGPFFSLVVVVYRFYSITFMASHVI
jgi:peptide subunit release factor RF-3